MRNYKTSTSPIRTIKPYEWDQDIETDIEKKKKSTKIFKFEKNRKQDRISKNATIIGRKIAQNKKLSKNK